MYKTDTMDHSEENQDTFSFYPTQSFSPKQTLTPITFAYTPSASPTSNVAFFTSIGMMVFYVIFAIIVILLVCLFCYFYFCKKEEPNMDFIDGTSDTNIEEMNKPLTENPNLPDDGTVMI